MTPAAGLQLDSTRVERSSSFYWALWWLVAVFSLWLRTGFPIHGIATGAFDDALFVRQARFLGAGMWLGPYDNLTLAKGMFYPLFILASFVAGISLSMAEQVVYLGVSALTGRMVLRMSASRRLAFAVFVVLALNPVVWNWEMDRVIREGLYISLSLAVVSLALAVGFPALRTGRPWRPLVLGVSLGLVLAAFWLTREEGPWILPALAVVVVASLISAWWLPPLWSMQGLRGSLRRVALPLAAAGLTFELAIGAVCTLNYIHYRLFITNEFKSAPFLRAYGALSRIKHDEWHRYVVFPEDARERAYSASPAARELAPVPRWTAGGSLAPDWLRADPDRRLS